MPLVPGLEFLMTLDEFHKIEDSIISRETSRKIRAKTPEFNLHLHKMTVNFMFFFFFFAAS